MRKDLLIIALGLSLASGTATADVLATPETDPSIVANAPATLPAKGITMAAVEKRFGAPLRRRPTVGGDSPKHPPITRWDYDGFSVIFEHDKVVDAVIPGAPPRVYHKDQLTPVAASAAPLPPVRSELAPPPPAEVPVMPPPADTETVPEAPAEEAAATGPATPVEPMAPSEPPPAESAPAAESEPAAQTAPANSYPDRPPAQTPAEEVPQDSPPTPK